MRFLSVNNSSSAVETLVSQRGSPSPVKIEKRGFFSNPLVPIIADDILHNLGITSLDSPGALVTKTTVPPQDSEIWS